jgi:hypothetical protein
MMETRGAGWLIRSVGSRSLFLARDTHQRVGRFYGVETRGTDQGARSSRSAEPKRATITQRLSRLRRSGSGGRRSSDRLPEINAEQRVETLEARVEHLEAELEGLQDAVYRRALVEDERIDELRARTAPEQLARDLSEDARKRGL